MQLKDFSQLSKLLSEDEQKELDQEKEKKKQASPYGENARVIISLDTKARRGKTVTVLDTEGITPDNLESLSQLLKKTSGAGGTVDYPRIEIQGDKIKALHQKLVSLGISVTLPKNYK